MLVLRSRLLQRCSFNSSQILVMDELFAAIVGVMAAVIKLMAGIIEVIFQVVFHMVARSLTLFALVVSSRFRQAKKKEWAEEPARRIWDLGIGSVCVGCLIALVVWFSLPDSPVSTAPATLAVSEKTGAEGFELRIKATGHDGDPEETTIEVSGVDEMLRTRSLDELREAIRKNVVVVQPGSLKQTGLLSAPLTNELKAQ